MSRDTIAKMLMRLNDAQNRLDRAQNTMGKQEAQILAGMAGGDIADVESILKSELSMLDTIYYDLDEAEDQFVKDDLDRMVGLNNNPDDHHFSHGTN